MQVQRTEDVYRKLAEVFVPHYVWDEKREKSVMYPIFIILIAFWFGMIYLSSTVEISLEEETIEIEKIPERFAQIIVPKLVEERRTQEFAKKEEKKERRAKEVAMEQKGEGGGEGGEGQQMTVQQRREIIRERVRTTGVLALLTARGEGSSPIAEILGGGISQSLDEILGGISGVRVAGGGEELKPLELAAGGGIRRRELDIGELAAKGGKQVELGEKKVAAIQSKIATESPEIEGEMDEETVRKIALKNQASLKYCFQKAQLRNPELSGKIVIRLTVDADGNVVDISVEQSTIDDQEMVSCVVRMVKRWKFPATGGEVNITFPLVFMSIS